MSDPLGLFENQGGGQDPLGLFSSKEDNRDFASKIIDEKLEGSPVAQQVLDAINPVRIAKGIPGGLAAAYRGAVELPVSGLASLANLGNGVGPAMEAGQKAGEAVSTVGGMLPKSDSEKAASEVMGAGFGKIAEGGGNLATEMPSMLGMGPLSEEEIKALSKAGKLDDKTLAEINKQRAMAQAGGEVVSQMVTPMPGAKMARAGVERYVGNKLEQEIKNQQYTNPDRIDPTTAGAKPTVERWDPNQGRLDFGENPLGLEFPQEHYEAGMPADAYLKPREVPQPGQGDMFANTRPYAEGEALPRAQEILARSEAERNAIPFEQPQVDQGSLQGQPKAQLQMPAIEPPNPGLEAGITFKGNREPGFRDRVAPDLEEVVNQHSAESGSPRPVEGVPNNYMQEMRSRSEPISFDQLPERAKEAIQHAEFMKSGVDPELKTAQWEKVTIPIDELNGGRKFVPDNSKSHSEGPILVDREGEIIDGTHRAMDAIAEGKTHIEAYRPVPKEQSNGLTGPHPPSGLMGIGAKGRMQGGFIDPRFLGADKAFDLVERGIKAMTNMVMSKGKTVEGMTEAAKLAQLDRRKAADVLSTLDPKTVQDIGTAAKAGFNFTDIDGIIAGAKGYNGAGAIIKWARDAFKLVDRSMTAFKEDLLKGTSTTTSGRGFEFRSTSPDSPVVLFKKGIKESVPEMNAMLKEWFSASAEGRSPEFTTDRQKAIYKAWQEVFGQIHNATNDQRMKAGLQPISKQESYFPLMRMGDYRIIIEDGQGNLRGAMHVPSIYHGKIMQKMLQKELPDLTIGDPTHLTKSKYDYGHSDFMAMEAASKALKDQPDVAAAVHKAYADIMQHRGFGGKRGVESNHILGAMGLEDGKVGATRALEAFESYTTKMTQYIANLEKKNKMAELIDALGQNPEIKSKLPNTIDLISDIYDSSRGGSQDKLKLLTDALNTAGRLSGLGENGFRTRLRDVSGLASAWLLATPSFIISNLLQAPTGMAGLVRTEGGGLGGLALAGKDILKGYAKTLMPDALSKEGVSWASKNGYITPEVAELYGLKQSDLNSSFVRKGKEAFSFVTGTIEKEAVRIPYFLMQLEALKGQIKDKTALFEAAAEQTDRYMVNYSRGNQALIWGKMGAAGENAKSLKAYSNNMLGQLTEYIGDAKKGDVVPLVTYIGMATLMAGITGNVFVQTADDIIRGINALTGANIPTIHEYVMHSGMSDLATFGAASTILGHDVSSSQAQNSVKSMFSIPFTSLGTQAVKDLYPYLVKLYQGTETAADKMKALLAITPPALKEVAKSQFIEDGVVPDPNHGMAKIYQRPEEKRVLGITATEFIGRPSLDEARSKAIIQAAREDLRENMTDRSSLGNALADRIISGQPVDDKLIEQWIMKGGNPSSINDLVKKRILDHSFDQIERVYQEKGTSGNARQEATTKGKEARGRLENQGMLVDTPETKAYSDTKGMSQMFKGQAGNYDQIYQERPGWRYPPGWQTTDPMREPYLPSDRAVPAPRLNAKPIRKQT